MNHGEVVVAAIFIINGQRFDDVNPKARDHRQRGDTIPGVRPANADRETMHAEFGAMLQAYDHGLRGGHGVLVVQGQQVCHYCKGDVKVLARTLQLDSLVVFDADGSVIEFHGEIDLLPIKLGGKSWN